MWKVGKYVPWQSRDDKDKRIKQLEGELTAVREVLEDTKAEAKQLRNQLNLSLERAGEAEDRCASYHRFVSGLAMELSQLHEAARAFPERK